MQIDIVEPQTPPPVARVWIVAMAINSFKGRRNVEVHLFRPDFEPEDADTYAWGKLLGDPIHEQAEVDVLKSRRVLFEAFTPEERDAVVAFLLERYENRVSGISACTLELPIPLGLPPLSDIPEGKTMGFIRFERLPNYSLPFVVHGFYDLARHEPLVSEAE